MKKEVITLVMLLVLCTRAEAWEPMKKPPQQRQTQTQEANANSESAANSESVSQGGDAGDNSLVNAFYSYAQSDRGAVNCFISGDGAAAGDGKFGALGIYWLDTNCWMDAVAANERDVEINALLKCGGKKYRNAIAYDQPKRQRQKFCVDKLMDSGMAQIREENAKLMEELERSRRESELCKEGIERCTEAFVEEMAK